MAFCHGFATVGPFSLDLGIRDRVRNHGSGLESIELQLSGRSAAW